MADASISSARASFKPVTLLKPAEFHNGIWLNPVPTEVAATNKLLPILKEQFSKHGERFPLRTLGPFHTDVSVYQTPPASGLRITLLGHSSVLFEIDGTTLLVDPVFSRRASLVQWFGPKRFFAPPLAIADLPPLDAVLLTHDHYDHLDTEAVRQLSKRTPLFLCSMGVDTHLRRWGITTPTHPMNWMDEFTVPSAGGTPLMLTALPARHFSGRGPRRYRTLWSSFLLETAHHRIYHGADSGHHPAFCEIGERYGPIDLALLEIGAWDPLWNDIHLGPDQALQAAQELKARAMMPIHWGLFNLAFHAWDQPPERLTEVAGAARMPLFVPEPGQPTEFTGEALNSLWWRRYQSAHPVTNPRTASSVATAASQGLA